jgi:hypothetical protein
LELEDWRLTPLNAPYEFKYAMRTFYYLGAGEGKSRKVVPHEPPTYNGNLLGRKNYVQTEGTLLPELWHAPVKG